MEVNAEDPKKDAKPLLNSRYEMVKKIGRGAYGSVYKVEDKKVTEAYDDRALIESRR